jgi:hypothetical protein
VPPPMQWAQKTLPAAHGDCCRARRPVCGTLADTYQRGVRLTSVNVDASTDLVRGAVRAADRHLHHVLMLIADIVHVQYHSSSADAPAGISIAAATAGRATLLLPAFDRRATCII